MIPCSKQIFFLRLFYNSSSFFFLLFSFLYFFPILVSNLFLFLASFFFASPSDHNDIQFSFIEREDVEHAFFPDYPDLCADENEPAAMGEENRGGRQKPSSYGSLDSNWEDMDDALDYEEEGFTGGSESDFHTEIIELNKHEACFRDENIEKVEACFAASATTQLEITSAKRFETRERDIMNGGDIFGDSFTVGSTSKSSSEWRSSNINRDSGTDDPFSSSSRRSCPKWESYTVFQKYDEETIFINRFSAQKLHETESLKSIQASPRSISERMVYKLGSRDKSWKKAKAYHELETAYVAQICLTWEALSWNYINFKIKRFLSCPARIAQEFQQFVVLLQRFIEIEPFEYGRRPEIYARFRKVAPKFLLVPEYRDSEAEQHEAGRIPSTSFLTILDDGIRAFMGFLQADRQNCRQMLTYFLKKTQTGSVNPTMVILYKKTLKKKKRKLEDVRNSGKCLRKQRMNVEESMRVFMCLIDLKIVSRVLRMGELNQERLQWCEQKMLKVKVCGKNVQRDSTPLFFPLCYLTQINV